MCGIIGIVANTPINNILVSSLKGLQHRGQQATGVATMDGDFMHIKKGLGLIRDVITEYDMTYLRGNAGLGHVRYPTAGSANDPEQAHPFYVNSPFGIILAHNGNLTNAAELRDSLLVQNHRHVRTLSDSEVLINVLAFELEQLTIKSHLNNSKIFAAVSNTKSRIRGGYAVVSLIANYGLIAFRDHYGIRPLVLGKKEDGSGSTTYLVASETCALDASGFEYVRDIKPSECIIITLDGKIESRICSPAPSLNICIFEYVYLSRPDSIVENVPVHLARQNMGKYLANTIKKHKIDIDVVVPIPDTSRISAIEVAHGLQKPYREGFVKHSFSGRTFMLSTQKERMRAVKNKLHPIKAEFNNRNVLLIDDSIVRGTTSAQIISIVRACGAKKVYIASAAPQIRYPNVYGIDMPTHNELVAYECNDEEIASKIGADKVFFQTLVDLKKSITDINPEIKNFEASCFDGKYITGDITTKYIDALLPTPTE